MPRLTGSGGGNVTTTGTQTLTNKTEDGQVNTFTNLPASALLGRIAVGNLPTGTTGTLTDPGADSFYAMDHTSVTPQLWQLDASLAFTGSSPTKTLGIQGTPSLTSVPINTGGWTIFAVTGSDFTTSTTGLEDVTGLTTTALSNSTKYRFQLELDITWAAGNTNGTQVAINYGGTGTAATVNCLMTATNTGATNAAVQTLNTINTASNAVCTFNTTNVGTITLNGSFVSSSTGTATLVVRVQHPTAGTTTVKVGSELRIKKARS
jgi:hypothetical protein